MARKKRVEIFRYKCTMTEEEFKTTRKAPQPDELISVASYYELNPEQDDRPERIKQELENLAPAPTTPAPTENN